MNRSTWVHEAMTSLREVACGSNRRILLGGERGEFELKRLRDVIEKKVMTTTAMTTTRDDLDDYGGDGEGGEEVQTETTTAKLNLFFCFAFSTSTIYNYR